MSKHVFGRRQRRSTLPLSIADTTDDHYTIATLRRFTTGFAAVCEAKTQDPIRSRDEVRRRRDDSGIVIQRQIIELTSNLVTISDEQWRILLAIRDYFR